MLFDSTTMAPISYTIPVTFLFLSASSVSAFIPVCRAPSRTTTPLQRLHATSQAQEAFQRSLLAARIANDAKRTNGAAAPPPPSSSAAVASSTPSIDAKKQEAFHRSLLSARIANDSKAAKIAAEAAAVASVATSALAVEEVDETEPVVEPDPVPELEPAVVTSTTTAPEPAVPKPVIPAPSPLSSTTTPTSPVQPTEFTIPREFALVPINEASVQFTAGILGATAGILLGGGPILAAFLAAATNYLSRKDDTPGGDATSSSAKKIVDTASQTALLMYNFLARFEKENKVVDTTLRLMESAVDKAKEVDSPASSTLIAVESTLGGVAKKVEELNDDYDLVGGVGTVLNSVGDLVEIAVDKVVELNEEYRFTDRVGEVVKKAVGKVTGDDKN